MSRRRMVMAAAVVISLSSSSCMHGLLMGEHSEHNDPGASPAHYEVVSQGHRLRVDIPAMNRDSEGQIRFSVNGPTSAAVPRRIVWNVRPSAPAGHDGLDSKVTSPGVQDLEGIALLDDGHGVAFFVPRTAGPHVLTALLSDEDDTLRAVVMFDVKSSDVGGLMGMGGGWTATVVVTAVMGGMMLAMWAIRGGW